MPSKEDDPAGKRKPEDAQVDDDSSSDDEAGPKPAAPGQNGEDSDTDGEAGPPAPKPGKPKKKRKLAHEKVHTSRQHSFLLCSCDALVGGGFQQAIMRWYGNG